MYRLGILGVGKMGNAILNGILNSGIMNKDDILLCLHSEEKKENYLLDGYHATTDNEELFKNCSIVLLAVKPQTFTEVLTPALKYDFSGKGIISIAAGISIDYMEKYFNNADIVRAMPNTPALIGKGVTTICYKKESETGVLAYNIFSSIGSCYVINENQMDESLPLNGSMPAYLYYFAKQFIDNAKENGMDEEAAKKLTAESIIASAEMILTQTDDLDTLINNVCSKGGTTIAGLNKLDERFTESLKECYSSCVERSKELKK